ncbi:MULTISPECIES: nuclear transport factor 2 family protein [unclassified Pseudofrankia]|uniref:nuclear transport factor 2 family protein n=1 Tax=unclassified Pseudofrankia TaxID=2994372 RepID=UPI0008DA76E2|nr:MULTISPECIES: nuclear transport factor 2 family protein [unclassified Pseudofrankia]MDT3440863.1 nuclear transport factor 2 family protein [Pseudofrankia sp. BMG5.37]OHV43704.1 hypothetical protein BCD48_27415 [Pseudofrankia sp. BMG5.36]
MTIEDLTPDSALTAAVRELADRAAILDCMHRYARGMDRLDRALARSAYHDDGIDDHGAFVGAVEDFLDWAFSYHADQARHQHYLANHSVELDGDRAHAETYYLFVASYPDAETPLTIVGGRYVDRLERRDERWGIVARVCLVEWQTTLPDQLTSQALAFLAQIQTVARDHTDASYDRPLVVSRSAQTAS